jgi:hypothetical protein
MIVVSEDYELAEMIVVSEDYELAPLTQIEVPCIHCSLLPGALEKWLFINLKVDLYQFKSGSLSIQK